MRKIVNNIPNILTYFRILVAMLIPFLFNDKNYNLLTILILIALLTDFFDGYLARKLKVTSQLGKKLDILADKLFAVSATIILFFNVSYYLIFTIIGEFLIMIPSLFFILSNQNNKKEKMNNFQSSKYGKFKTWLLFLTLFIAFISYKLNLNIILYVFIVITFILQVLTAKDYIDNYLKSKK